MVHLTTIALTPGRTSPAELPCVLQSWLIFRGFIRNPLANGAIPLLTEVVLSMQSLRALSVLWGRFLSGLRVTIS